MVMDYVEGESYDARLRRIGKEPDQASLMAVMGPIMEGIEEIHAKNLLHRDIKPDNILIDKRGKPVLIDFGSARMSVGATMTMTSMVTHGYSPIEQYQTKGRMGPWTDIYAIGAVMCRAITGEKPPVAADRLMADDFEWLSYRSFEGFSPVFLRTVDWALRVKPEERPPSILEWREILSANADEIIERTDHSAEVSPVNEPVQPPPITPPQSLKTDPLSIWSLVLGIISILGCSFGGFIVGIPAVICGHIGLSRIKRQPSLGGRGMAIAGLITGYLGILTLPIAASLALPAITRAVDSAKATQMLSNMRQIHMAVLTAQNDGATTGNPNLGFPASAKIESKAALKEMLVSEGYISADDLEKLKFNDMSVANISDEDPVDTIFLKATMGKTIIIFRKGGDGDVYPNGKNILGLDPPRSPAFLD
jgi:type II secretory pathway pseudopilin PulG